MLSESAVNPNPEIPMPKPTYEFHVSYEYSLDQLAKDLREYSSDKTQIYLQPNSDCGGNTRVLVFTEDKDELETIKRAFGPL